MITTDWYHGVFHGSCFCSDGWFVRFGRGGVGLRRFRTRSDARKFWRSLSPPRARRYSYSLDVSALVV